MAVADASMALKNFEIANNIETLESDQIFEYDLDAQRAYLSAKPWLKDPHYFKRVKISALALLKMVMHARSGGTLEVMGVMQGKIEENTLVVLDSFELPVEGTETRVTALDEAYEYLVQYHIGCEKVGRVENVVGWYHSHPGYGCWLSGIDVNTQMTNQQNQEPFLAIVIDPTRTCAAGKVEIGAFRTYPKDYKAADAGPSEYQSIPLDKIEDFGVHCKHYYPLEVSYFKSSLDTHLLNLLWNKYWINTLSSSPLLNNREYTVNAIADMAKKVESAESQLSHSSRSFGYHLPQQQKKEESPLNQIIKDSSKTAVEQVHGVMNQIVKDVLFSARA
eukprot:JP446308.1.p1 GENE.JP446308.1~~JP446308.1.p1  ORF type:complete len:334 (-),score=63.18 JP446308.1:197-1198(-)